MSANYARARKRRRNRKIMKGLGNRVAFTFVSKAPVTVAIPSKVPGESPKHETVWPKGQTLKAGQSARKRQVWKRKQYLKKLKREAKLKQRHVGEF